MEELMKETKAGQTVPTSETEPKKKFGLPKSKKAKKWMKIAAAAVVIAALAAGCMARASKKANAYLGGSYLVAQATRQDLTLSVTGTATLKPADSYNVTTLISGEIENAPFELGDLVNKGDLLFALDSSDAQNNVDRAEISVAQAKMAYQQAKEALNPVASISGTIQGAVCPQRRQCERRCSALPRSPPAWICPSTSCSPTPAPRTSMRVRRPRCISAIMTPR